MPARPAAQPAGLFLSTSFFPLIPMPARHLPTTTLNGKTYRVDEPVLQLRNVADPRDIRQFDSLHDLRTYLFWTEQLQFVVGRRLTRAEMVYDEDLGAWTPVLTFDDGQK